MQARASPHGWSSCDSSPGPGAPLSHLSSGCCLLVGLVALPVLGSSLAASPAARAVAGGAHALAAEAGFHFTSVDHASIPIQIHNNHIWMRGALNRDSVAIVLDSGAGGDCIRAAR